MLVSAQQPAQMQLVFLQHGSEQGYICAAWIQQNALASVKIGKQIAHCTIGLVREYSKVHNVG